MPNDARFGLVIGVVLVIAAGVMFFQNEPQPVSKVSTKEASAPITSPAFPSAALPAAPVRPVANRKETKAQTTAHTAP